MTEERAPYSVAEYEDQIRALTGANTMADAYHVIEGWKRRAERIPVVAVYDNGDIFIRSGTPIGTALSATDMIRQRVLEVPLNTGQ